MYMSTLDRPRRENLVHFYKLIIMSSALFTMMQKNEREIPFEIEYTQKSFVCEMATAEFHFHFWHVNLCGRGKYRLSLLFSMKADILEFFSGTLTIFTRL